MGGTAVIVGIARVKDEQDIIATTVGHMLTQVDRVIVEDNGSTDGTLDILNALDVEVLRDDSIGYYQSRAMSRLARYAAERGADVVIPFDADELWYSPFGAIREVLANHPAASIYKAALYDHIATGADTPDTDPVQRMAWRRREPTPLPKVAVRVRPKVTIHQGNHGADYGDTIDGLLVVRHYPYRSVEQFVSKVRNGAAAYAATDLPEDMGKHWRDYGRLLEAGGPDAIADVFRAWFWTANPRANGTLICDPAPVECASPS